MLLPILALVNRLGAVTIVAQTPGGFLPLWAEGSIVGLLLVGFMTEQIVSGKTHNRMREERDKAWQDLREADRKYINEFMPLMTDFILTAEKMLLVIGQPSPRSPKARTRKQDPT